MENRQRSAFSNYQKNTKILDFVKKRMTKRETLKLQELFSIS